MLPLLLPLVSGALLPLFRFRREGWRNAYVLFFTLLTSVLTLWLLLSGEALSLSVAEIYPGLCLAFRLDDASRLFAGLVAVLWPLCVLYGFAYMRHEERPNTFFAWYTMSYGVTLCCALSANLFTLYIFYECLSLVTLPLVSHKQDKASIRAGRLYIAYTITGAALGFIAMAVAMQYGLTLDFTPGGVLTGEAAQASAELLRWVWLLAFLGFGVKAAVLPLSAWLPAASVAPTPVTALLHTVAVVNTGAFAVMRVTYGTWGTELLKGSVPQGIALGLSCLTLLYASATAVRENHLKRRLAWSTVSNLSYMLMGLCLMTADGVTGALAHLVFHGLMKITLFLCAGAILTQTGLNHVREMGGLHRVMPLTCALFAIASVALVGTPPLVGFVSKWQLLTAAADLGGWMGLLAIASVILSSVLTAIYLFSAVGVMCFRPAGPALGSEPLQRREAPWEMWLPLCLLTLSLLALGVWSSPLLNLMRAASVSLF